MSDIKISETDPGEEPLAAAAPELTNAMRYSVDELKSRAAMIDFVKNSRVIPLEDQACILKRIENIPATLDILRLTAIAHPHRSGCNVTWTVSEA